MKTLLQHRNKVKQKKPRFICQDAHKKARLTPRWRRPKGIQSKMRLKIRGYRRSPSVGWGSPAAVRGMTKDGMVPVLVRTMNDVEQIDPKQEVAVLGGGLGKRKKIGLIKQMTEKQIRIDNMKDPSSFIEKVNSELRQRKEEKQERTQKKEAREKEQREKEEKEKQEQEAQQGQQGDLADKVSEQDSSSGEGQSQDGTSEDVGEETPSQETDAGSSEEAGDSQAETSAGDEAEESSTPSGEGGEDAEQASESEKSGKSESQ